MTGAARHGPCRGVPVDLNCVPARAGEDEPMNQSLSDIQTLLQEVARHLVAETPADKRQAVQKLQRIAAIASTAAFTLAAGR